MGEKDLKFTDTHEWVRVEGDVATLGLTDYAQGELTDIVFVEPVEPGRSLSAGDALTTVESYKSISEFYSPFDGEVVEGNKGLDDAPTLINTDPYGEGWIVKIKLAAGTDLSQLMTAEQYEKHIKG